MEAMRTNVRMLEERLETEEFETEEAKEEVVKEKEELEAKIMQEEAGGKVEKKKVIPRVKDNDKLNIVLVGPEKSGKSTLASYLQEE